MIKKKFEPGKFLLINGRVWPIINIEFSANFGERASCLDQDVTLNFAASNDIMNMQSILSGIMSGEESADLIFSISITEAVSFGWRAFSKSIWESKVTAEMKEEYLSAIKTIVDNLPFDKKQRILIENIAFRRAIGGEITPE